MPGKREICMAMSQSCLWRLEYLGKASWLPKRTILPTTPALVNQGRRRWQARHKTKSRQNAGFSRARNRLLRLRIQVTNFFASSCVTLFGGIGTGPKVPLGPS